jgi:adenylate cyclase
VTKGQDGVMREANGRASAAPAPGRPRRWAHSASLGRLRLATGLTLFLYVSTHLVNHALGLFSLAAAEAGRGPFLALWRFPPLEAALALALLVHVALGLYRLWERRTLRLRPIELVQLGLGLLIPAYLTVHVLGTGWLHRCCGVDDSYGYLLGQIWPDRADNYMVLVLLVWVHGVIGAHQWLRLRPGYRRAQPWLLVAATLLPVLAIGGFVNAGRELAGLKLIDPAGWVELAQPQAWALDPAFRERLVSRPEQ